MFYKHYVHRSNLFGATILGFLAGAAAIALLGKKKSVLREKYDEMVDEVTDKYARAKGISKNELKDLTDDLKEHWAKIKDTWNKGGETQ